ncbi:transposase [Trichonephila clavipes]|nr:transposase [Trichonephila clavipes]
MNVCKNEIADGFAREGSHEDSTRGGCLSFSEIATLVKQDIGSSWRQAPVCKLFRCGHTRAQRHVAGVFPPSPNCNVTRDAPALILACIGCHKSQLLSSPRILFSDEAHFWLNGYVNKQNCRIWSEANPQVYVETPLHPKKLTVWCALWTGGIIGPYFFKNDEGHNVTVNGDRYRALITNFFIPESNNHDVQELWFQQDGATCHTARATIDLLKDTFVDRLISRFGPVNWHPRSCDLTPLDYFLWGYVKALVYADKPQTLDHLEDNIRRVIADIRPKMLEKLI